MIGWESMGSFIYKVRRTERHTVIVFLHMNIRAVWRAAVTYSHEGTIKGAGCWNQT